jgi:hypothetical protein
MSEYQYYEFVAIDRPLTAEQQDELRAVSTRGRISSASFVNDYQWGDLKADPRAWMERYFDAHLYLANWGTHRIALRLPRAALDPATAAGYCVGGAAESWTTRTHVIVDLHSEDEDGVEDWVDPEGRLAAIAPTRTELAEGDLRPLYLAWLLVVHGRELDEEELEVSEPLTVTVPSAAVLGRWVTGLPEADKDELLLRVLRGDGALLRSEILRRFHGVTTDQPTEGGRTVGELLAAGEKVWARRQEATRKRKAAERRRREQEAAAAREKRLDVLAANPVQAWKQVDALIGAKRAKEYDAAVTLLEDLHALAVRTDDLAGFAVQMGRLREQNTRRPSLIDRFDRAELP